MLQPIFSGLLTQVAKLYIMIYIDVNIMIKKSV